MRWIPIVGGLALLMAWLRLGAAVDFRAELGRAFHYVSWREGLFWISHWLLALPACLLIASGFSSTLRRPVRRALQALDGSTRRRRRLAGIGLAALILLLALLGNRLLLLGLAITDDENAVGFGAHIVASGQLAVPLPEPAEAFPLLFTYLLEDGRLTSMDYPGGVFWAALALVSGTGNLLYALLAALSGLALVTAAFRIWGSEGGVMTALLWLVSPMVLTLSMTTHPHLLSRSFVAFALAAYLELLFSNRASRCNGLDTGSENEARQSASEATRRGRLRLVAALLGLASGLALLCRPLESVALLWPVAAHLIWSARVGRVERAVVLWAALPLLPLVVLFALHNRALTGLWFVPPRFAPGASSLTATELGPWNYLGTNLGFNLVMLGVFLLGPPGLALVYCGLRQRGALRWTLGAGLVSVLALALLHGDGGLHMVGPIHYSEAAVPLLLLAVQGWLWLRQRLAGLGLSNALLPYLPACVASLVLFSVVHSVTLRSQAEVLQIPRQAIAEQVQPPALVVADPQHQLWELRPELGRVRSWMVEYPHPDPFLEDPVLIVYPKVPPEQLRAAFPGRNAYRMTYRSEGEPVQIVPLWRAGEPHSGEEE